MLENHQLLPYRSQPRGPPISCLDRGCSQHGRSPAQHTDTHAVGVPKIGPIRVGRRRPPRLITNIATVCTAFAPRLEDSPGLGEGEDAKTEVEGDVLTERLGWLNDWLNGMSCSRAIQWIIWFCPSVLSYSAHSNSARQHV